MYPLVDPAEAAELVLDRTPVLEVEDVPLAEGWGRVLGEDLVAPREIGRASCRERVFSSV